MTPDGDVNEEFEIQSSSKSKVSGECREVRVTFGPLLCGHYA